jgi:hypothetical protein
MIDWPYVGWSALWILGLSVELSVISIAVYRSSERNLKLRGVLGERGFRTGLDLGMVLFSLGLFGLAGAWWERVLWGLLCAGFVFNLWQDNRNKAGINHG